jgi:DNA-binding SARP family transcriptional activator
MDAIWGESGGTNPGHSLHVAVSSLRHYLACSRRRLVRFQAGWYGLDRADGISHDVALFDERATSGEIAYERGDDVRARTEFERAVALYLDDYCLHHLGQPWAFMERERLISRYHLTLQRLGEIELRRRECETAAKYFQLLVERDPFREDIQLSLMIVYLMMGRTRDAIQQFETCRVALEQELGIEPNVKLQQLRGSILTSMNESVIDLSAWLQLSGAYPRIRVAI